MAKRGSAEPDEIMTVDEIVAYLKVVTPRWVRREARAQGLPLYRVSRQLVGYRREIDAWVKQQQAD